MSALLERLGVPRNIQLFFKPHFSVLPDGSLSFPFGDDQEHFGQCYHRIPFAINHWTAGIGPVHFIAFSAMECLAFLCLNQHRYPDFGRLRFTAIGLSQPAPVTGKHKTCLLFGNDVLGRLNDIYFSCQLRSKKIGISYLGDERYRLAYKNRSILLDEDRISLSAAEKGLGIRSGIRTAKPKPYSTFLEQLQHQSSWY